MNKIWKNLKNVRKFQRKQDLTVKFQRNLEITFKKFLENMIKYNNIMLGYVQENLGKFCEDCKNI